MSIDSANNPLNLPDFEGAGAGWDAVVQEALEALAPQNALHAGNAEVMTGHADRVQALVPVQMPSYTVAGLPSASPAGMMVYVSNASGGAVTAFSDGSDWRRTTDRAVVT